MTVGLTALIGRLLEPQTIGCRNRSDTARSRLGPTVSTHNLDTPTRITILAV
jgi:hypothetical protein